MNRRSFMVMAAGLGGLGTLVPAMAQALSISTCDDDISAASCQALNDHQALLTKIRQSLADQGLSDDQQRVVLAALSCPTCGLSLQPLDQPRF